MFQVLINKQEREDVDWSVGALVLLITALCSPASASLAMHTLTEFAVLWFMTRRHCQVQRKCVHFCQWILGSSFL